MKNKQNFGELSAKSIKIGDLVEWTTWNLEKEDWDSHFGVVFEIKNKIVGNRLISASRIMPINGDKTEIECFTMNLRTVSRSENHNNE